MKSMAEKDLLNPKEREERQTPMRPICHRKINSREANQAMVDDQHSVNRLAVKEIRRNGGTDENHRTSPHPIAESSPMEHDLD